MCVKSIFVSEIGKFAVGHEKKQGRYREFENEI